MTVYISGHKNPDTDSILAPIVYENYLKNDGLDAQAIKIGPINKESKFILDKYGFDKPKRVDTLPEGSNIIMVDHNEKTQAIDNIDDLNIIGVIDHHKFGNFSTAKPLSMRVEPLGSSCSILYEIFKEKGYKLPKELAKLLISGIISDTLYFRSPTTTNFDKVYLEELNQIAEIDDLEKHSLDMFNAKSDLGDISAEEIIKTDYKNFDMNGKKVGIGVVETTNPMYMFNKQSELLDAMQHIKENDGLNYIFLCVIDILNNHNTTIVLGADEEKVLYEVFKSGTQNHIADLGSRVSRKKQLVPELTKYFDCMR